MRIGELAGRAGVSATTIRYYEDIGLMEPPLRRLNGYREYGAEAEERLRFIRDAQAAGLSLTEVSEIVVMKSSGESTCAHTTTLLERHVADVDRQIASLQAARGELVRLLDRARALDPAECTDNSRCRVIPLDIPVNMKV